VRVPEAAANGDAQATLWFRDWKEVKPVTLDFEVK
jgi:hypothetical protein